MLLGVESCSQPFASLSCLEGLDYVGCRVLPLAADEVRLTDGGFDGFPDLAEVAMDLLGRGPSWWPCTGLLNLVEVVLGERTDGTGREARFSAYRIEEDFSDGVEGGFLDRPALAMVKLEPQLGRCLTATDDKDVAEFGAKFLEVFDVEFLLGIGEPPVRVDGLDFSSECPVELMP